MFKNLLLNNFPLQFRLHLYILKMLISNPNLKHNNPLYLILKLFNLLLYLLLNKWLMNKELIILTKFFVKRIIYKDIKSLKFRNKLVMELFIWYFIKIPKDQSLNLTFFLLQMVKFKSEVLNLPLHLFLLQMKHLKYKLLLIHPLLRLVVEFS